MPKQPVLRERMERFPTSGERVRFWVSATEQATLRAYAAEHGVTIHQAAHQLLREHLAALRLEPTLPETEELIAMLGPNPARQEPKLD